MGRIIKLNWNNGTLQTSHLRIQITNSHVWAKGFWVMHVREFNWNTKHLMLPATAPEEEAQKAAVKLVKQYLQEMLNSVENQ